MNDELQVSNARPSAPRSHWPYLRAALMVAALLALVGLAHGGVLSLSWVHYDDNDYVLDNGKVQEGLTLDGLKWALSTRLHKHFHPLTWLSHMLDAELYLMDPWGHHLSSLLLHAACVLLLFGFLWRLSERPWHSLVAAALFAVHPVHVENVAWIADRKDLLVACFGLLVLWAYSAHVRRPSRQRLQLTALLLLIGLMAKATLITWPVLLLVLDLWWYGRTGLPALAGGAVPRVSLRELLREKALLLLAVVPALVLSLMGDTEGVPDAAARDLLAPGMLVRGVCQTAFYVATVVVPAKLVPIYPPLWSLSAIQIGAAVLLLLGLSAGSWRLRQRVPALWAGWLWFVVSISLMGGFFMFGPQTRALRYLDLPALGLYVAAVWGAAALLQRIPGRRWIAAALAIGLLLPATLITRRQLGYWYDDLSLYGRSLELEPDNPQMQGAMFGSLYRRHRYEESLPYARRLAKMDPSDKHTSMLATVLEKLGRRQEAEEVFQNWLRRDPNSVPALAGMGHLLRLRGEYPAAALYYQTALRLQPTHIEANYRLGTIAAYLGQRERAIHLFGIALNRKPSRTDIRYDLGVAMLEHGDYKTGLQLLERAMQEKPDLPGLEEQLRRAWQLAMPRPEEPAP